MMSDLIEATGLTVVSPDGRRRVVELTGTELTVGRRTPHHEPGVALEPDPHNWVGRTHLRIELRGGKWYAVDGGTENGTMVEHRGRLARLDQDQRLHHGDTMWVLGDTAPDGEPRYWRLTFRDPHSTRGAPPDVSLPSRSDGPPALEFERSSAQVFRRIGGERVLITDLRPKARDLIDHMVGKAEATGSSMVVCTHAELLRALYGAPETWPHSRARTAQDIRDIVSDARQAIEPESGKPVLLQTVQGLGYRIVAWLPGMREREAGTDDGPAADPG